MIYMLPSKLHKDYLFILKEAAQMKKLFVLILTVALLLSVAGVPAMADERGAAWQTIGMEGAAADLMSEGYIKTFRYQTFTGPGKGYSQAGAYLPRKISVKAVHSENEYALLDVEYNGGRRCVYLEKKYVKDANLKEITVNPVAAKTKATICPMYYGPGTQYDAVTQRMKSKYADMPMAELRKIFNNDEEKIKKALKDVFPKVQLDGGSEVKVLFEANGWVCIESECTILGKARTWIPADQVTAK